MERLGALLRTKETVAGERSRYSASILRLTRAPGSGEDFSFGMSGVVYPLPPSFFAQSLREKALKGGLQVIPKIQSPAAPGLISTSIVNGCVKRPDALLQAGCVRIGKLRGEACGRMFEAKGRLKICEGETRGELGFIRAAFGLKRLSEREVGAAYIAGRCSGAILKKIEGAARVPGSSLGPPC